VLHRISVYKVSIETTTCGNWHCCQRWQTYRPIVCFVQKIKKWTVCNKMKT